MKLLFTLCCIIVFSIARAGIIIGYQTGFYTYGMANVQSSTYYYNKVAHANFNYHNFFHGPYVGFRFDFNKGWVTFAWNNKHNIYTSDYTYMTLPEMRLGIKVRMNELILEGGYRIKNIGIGGGFNMSQFSIFSKRAAPPAYGSAKWGSSDYGSPIRLFGLPDYPSFSLCADYYLSDHVILKGTWHFGIGHITFSNDASLTFYDFNPTNLTFALLFKLGSLK
jgi:hypothetical protein